MRNWLILLGGPVVWTVHFFGLYAIAEIMPHVGLVLLLSLICIAANLWLLHRGRQIRADSPFITWQWSVAMGGALVSLIAVCWQALPALVH